MIYCVSLFNAVMRQKIKDESIKVSRNIPLSTLVIGHTGNKALQKHNSTSLVIET